MQAHKHVRNPKDILSQAKAESVEGKKLYALNDRLLDWITNHVLASITMFDIALIVPLIAIPMSNSIKLTLAVISSSWIQWWALPALQRSQNKIQAQNDAKAETDHETLTYVATAQDQLINKVEKITQLLEEKTKP